MASSDRDRVSSTLARPGLRLIAIVLTLSATPALAEAPRWQIGTMPSFSTGRYGGEARTEILHTAFTARRLFDTGDVTVVVPITCIRGDGSVTVAGGSPIRTLATPENVTRPADRSLTNGRDTRQAATVGTETTATGATPPPAVTSTCGPGDVVVRARYFIVDERGWVPAIALRGHVKAPTASARRGLGTGRPDEGVGIEVSRSLGSALLIMGDAGYTIMGDPAGMPLGNRWWYDAGLARRFGSWLDLGVFLEAQSAIVSGTGAARNVLGVVNIIARAGWRLQVAAEFGLSDAAPDHGLSIGASRRF